MMKAVRSEYLVIHPDGTQSRVDTEEIADVAYMVNVCLFDGSEVYVTYNDGSKRHIVVRRDGKNSKEIPMMLVTDGCGSCYCPRCHTFMEDYHISTHSIDGMRQRYCHNCGQRLIWDIDWETA